MHLKLVTECRDFDSFQRFVFQSSPGTECWLVSDTAVVGMISHVLCLQCLMAPFRLMMFTVTINSLSQHSVDVFSELHDLH